MTAVDEPDDDAEARPPWALAVGILVLVTIGLSYLGAEWLGLWPPLP